MHTYHVTPQPGSITMTPRTHSTMGVHNSRPRPLDELHKIWKTRECGYNISTNQHSDYWQSQLVFFVITTFRYYHFRSNSGVLYISSTVIVNRRLCKCTVNRMVVLVVVPRSFGSKKDDCSTSIQYMWIVRNEVLDGLRCVHYYTGSQVISGTFSGLRIYGSTAKKTVIIQNINIYFILWWITPSYTGSDINIFYCTWKLSHWCHFGREGGW
jgi:hypothetical protein